MEAWYALYTKPGCEFEVERVLAARGLTVYLPVLPATDGGHPEPLFPRYLFVWRELVPRDDPMLEWTPGLCEVVSFGGRPAAVPEEAIYLIHVGLDRLDIEPAELPEPMIELQQAIQPDVPPHQRVRRLACFLRQANGNEAAEDDAPDFDVSDKRKRPRRGTRGHGRHIHYREP